MECKRALSTRRLPSSSPNLFHFITPQKRIARKKKANGKSIMSTAIKSAKSIQPLLNRVLIQRTKPETKTASGLFLPEKSNVKLNDGTVLSVGPGGIDDTTGKVVQPYLKVGQRVLLPQFGGTPVQVGEEEFSLFKESEILAIISEQ